MAGHRRRTAEPPPGNIPVQFTSFIGREQELAEVQQLLTTARLVTLSGAGGCGKTRLALEAASAVGAEYPDGVWLVELAPLKDGSVIASTVARAVRANQPPGADVMQSLLAFLRHRCICLVLDNCEHLVEASAWLVESLLRECPELRVLATSREPLGVPRRDYLASALARSPVPIGRKDCHFRRTGLLRFGEAPRRPCARHPSGILSDAPECGCGG